MIAEITSPAESIERLRQLISISEDCRDGYHEASESVRNNDLKELFAMISTQRREFAMELQRLVLSFHGEPDPGKDFPGMMRLFWLELKAALTAGDEHTILFECERGEEAAVDAYRGVLKDTNLPADVRLTVERQWEAVQKSHERIRHLRIVSDPKKQPVANVPQ
jgi:uncharacterized protein (TIGR02284 family)